MIFAQERKRLIELVINNNVKEVNFVKFAQENMVAAPLSLLERWCENFYKVSPIEFTNNPRLVNRFCVGADPEFVFSLQVYQNSLTYGLNTLEAFGSDLTGRQAELRAYPSRSVLEVVASILDTLRHMSEACPATLGLKWLALALAGADGCGGHVHIGRKVPDIKKTIPSLDVLSKLLIHTNVVHKETSKLRHDMTKYGKDGDFRLQPHGFEYRTMPTWLDNPWSAFLTLTLSKLCVLHNLKDLRGHASTQTIENLLRAFANIDDDANIALQCFLRIGLPLCSNDDFKGRWGITTASPASPKLPVPDRNRYFYPPIIPPSPDSCLELFNHLTKGWALNSKVPKPTWVPFKLDENLFKIYITPHYAGLPEIAMGLLSKGISVSLSVSPNPTMMIRFPTKFINFDIPAIRQIAQKLEISPVVVKEEVGDSLLSICMPSDIAKDYIVNLDRVQAIRKFLTSFGLFPIAKYDQIEDLDMRSFNSVKKNEPQLLGSLVRELSGNVKDPLKVGETMKEFKLMFDGPNIGDIQVIIPQPQHLPQGFFDEGEEDGGNF